MLCKRGRIRSLPWAMAAAVVLTLLALAGVPAGLTPASAAACAGWSGAQPSASPSSRLRAIAVVSECDVWAAGTPTKHGPAALYHWTGGSSWTAVDSPNPGGGFSAINAMTAVSATDIWATGTFGDAGTPASFTGHALILHWDGTSWTQQPIPGDTGFGLAAVSATSASNAWAVGTITSNGSQQTLILHWDGTSWTRQPSPGPGSGFLTSVAATSPGNAWAVGGTDSSHALILHWDGISWAQVSSPVPTPNGGLALTGVTATSAGDAWTVGSVDQGARTFIAHWDGTNWTQVPSPSPDTSPQPQNTLEAVVAVSPGNAWAVGEQGLFPGSNGQPSRIDHLLLHWNGTSWTIMPDPSNITAHNLLHGVGVGPAGTVWAAGESEDLTSDGIPFRFDDFAAPVVGIVPSVAGDTPDAATAAIHAADLAVTGTVSVTNCAFSRQGTVVSTTPGAGELRAPAFGILLNVCTIPPQTVPDLGGDTITRARQQLAAVGLILGSVTTVIQCDEIGLVQSQQPTAGTLAAVGTAVAVTVAQQSRSHPCE
jgi:hypothetical protein